MTRATAPNFEIHQGVLVVGVDIGIGIGIGIDCDPDTDGRQAEHDFVCDSLVPPHLDAARYMLYSQ
jgi:hypothetical protein